MFWSGLLRASASLGFRTHLVTASPIAAAVASSVVALSGMSVSRLAVGLRERGGAGSAPGAAG